jgi:hypothetical protein
MGTPNFFLSPQFAIPQLEGSTYAIATPQLFKDTYVAPQPKLRNSVITFFPEVRNFKSAPWELTVNSATWELKFCNFWHIFGRGIRSFHGKKIGGKKSRTTFSL